MKKSLVNTADDSVKLPAESLIVIRLDRSRSGVAQARILYATEALAPALIRNALIAVAHQLLPPVSPLRLAPGPVVSSSVTEGQPLDRVESARFDTDVRQQHRTVRLQRRAKKRRAVHGIGVNLWDDYYDDDFVPEGQTQATYIYVESDTVTPAEQVSILQIVYDCIQTMPPALLDQVSLRLTEQALHLVGLTHRAREGWVIYLQKSGLSYQGQRLLVYSES